MFNLEENATITICPNYPTPSCGATRFRWRMECALPFVMPINEEVTLETDKDGQRFRLHYFNGCDRLIVIPSNERALPTTYLAPKLKSGDVEPTAPEGTRISREHLQSAAVFYDLLEYGSIEEAFKNAESKVKTCFEILGEHLATLQRALPYLVTWTIYPISHFDVGVAYHSVDHFCPASNDWKLVQCNVES